MPLNGSSAVGTGRYDTRVLHTSTCPSLPPPLAALSLVFGPALPGILARRPSESPLPSDVCIALRYALCHVTADDQRVFSKDGEDFSLTAPLRGHHRVDL